MPKLASEKLVKKLANRDGKTEYVDDLNTVQVKFAKQFVKVPKIFINVDGDVNYKITGKNTSGFKVQFKDGNFAATNYAGEMEWEAVPMDALE